MRGSMWTFLSFCYVLLNSPRLIIKRERNTHIPGVKKKKKNQNKNFTLIIKKFHCCKTCSVYSSFVIVIKTIDLKLNADAVM